MSRKKDTSESPGRFDLFRKFAHGAAHAVGTPWAFVIAALLIITWAISGPIFGFSDTWQLVINTGTTIVTFLMVFLIQNTQNRDAKAMHLKLDELIRSIKGARNRLVDLEDMSDKELDKLQRDFERLRKHEGMHPRAIQTVEEAGEAVETESKERQRSLKRDPEHSPVSHR
jgi:low affinity Fe/Cu permease